MASDIVSCLQLDRPATGRIIVIKEINSCDSAFIDSCVLSNCIKNKTPVVFLSMHNSQSHFQSIGLKMNYNLQKHVDSGLIEFYHLGNYCVNNLLENVHFSIQDIFIKVKEMVLAKQINEPVNVIVDGVSHLFDMGFTLKDVNNFCNQLFDLVRHSNSFLIYHCNQASDDDVTHTMSNLLVHKATTVVEVENLQSGWSTDVSGHLSVKHLGQKYQNEHMFTLHLKPTRYLFKLFDRGVKLLAPGTV